MTITIISLFWQSLLPVHVVKLLLPVMALHLLSLTIFPLHLLPLIWGRRDFPYFSKLPREIKKKKEKKKKERKKREKKGRESFSLLSLSLHPHFLSKNFISLLSHSKFYLSLDGFSLEDFFRSLKELSQ